MKTRNPSILICDDEVNIRLMLRTTLQSEGYDINEASNGREALEMISQSVPDVMILDLSMPQLDGLGVLSELRGVKPDRKPRIIVLTAYGSIATAVKATRLGAIDFLEKPVSPDEVRESVQAALEEPQQIVAEGEAGYAEVLDRVRKALRLAKYTDAETLLMKAADLAHNDSTYYNLLGVLYESRRQWRLACKFYEKAIKNDKRYEPAQQNLRRMYEILRSGHSAVGVVLGDEPEIFYARLPE